MLKDQGYIGNRGSVTTILQCGAYKKASLCHSHFLACLINPFDPSEPGDHPLIYMH